jgi:hypothetical protein
MGRKVYKVILMIHQFNHFSIYNPAEIENKKQKSENIFIMKAFITALALASSYALAAPAEPLVKRASVSDVRLTSIHFP